MSTESLVEKLTRTLQDAQETLRAQFAVKVAQVATHLANASPAEVRAVLDRLTDDLLAQFAAAYLGRLHRDFANRNARAQTLRDAFGRFLYCQSVFYLAQTDPELAANEHLIFTAQEGKAQLNALVQAMFKELRGMLVKVVKTARSAGAKNSPFFAEVRAPGTSMYHFECGGVRKKRGLVDRRASADYGQCQLCGKIVDCHQNAARNIAASHPDYDPPP